MTALPLATKEVSFGTFTMTVPAGWGFERQEDGFWFWGDPSDSPGVLVGQDERPIDPAGTTNADKVAPVVAEFREILTPAAGFRSFDTIAHPEGVVLRVVTDDDPDGIWEIRWYTAMVREDEPVALLFRIRLILKSEDHDTPLAIALDDLFHDQAVGTTLYGHRGRRPLPPTDFFRPMRRASFDAVITCNLPLAWVLRHNHERHWWCSNGQYLGSMNVYYTWAPADLDEIDIPASVTASTRNAAHKMLDGRSGVGVDVKQAGERTVTHSVFSDGTLGEVGDPDDEPLLNHFWHVGQAVEGGILIAGFDLMIPLRHAEEEVFRQLVEDMWVSVKTAILRAPGPPPAQQFDEAERQFDLDRLQARTCYDFINICVPRRWKWEEANGRGSFAAEDESEETGTLWVDYDFRKFEHEVTRTSGIREARAFRDRAASRFAESMEPIADIGTGDHPDGGVMWACSRGEERGDLLRIYRYDHFLLRPNGLLIVHFNLVLLEDQADEPEFADLIMTVGREIEAARIL